MRGKLMFLGGLAVGFVLGSRAGRPAYDELVRTARRVKDSPGVQEAAGVVQAQASKLFEQGKGSVADKFANTRFGERMMHNGSGHVPADGATASSTNAGPSGGL